jgi:hypothetical protein
MNKFTIAFELGIHYGILCTEWDQLKDCPSTFNAIEKEFIQKKINNLNVSINQTNFGSLKKLKQLKKDIKKVDDYMCEERKKSRILKDLSSIPNLTTCSSSSQ